MKIAICASEVVPFAKTGGLADVAGALPLALEKEGQEVIIVMPKYKTIQESKFKLTKVKDGVFSTLIGKAIKVYFIEKESLYNRDNLYGEKTGDYPDNLERFSYFCKKALELLKELNFKPDIIHTHDWQTSLIPVYLKTNYKNDAFFKNTKTILTIHNMGYQGLFEKEEFPRLGLDWSLFNMSQLEFFDQINLLKGGLVFADMINTVSPTYAKEIQTEDFGFGLEGILLERKNRLSGILNGIDYDIWNPETDKYIKATFSLKNVGAKEQNKQELQKICNLPIRKDVPLFGIVSRLAEPKGFDIIAEGIEEICKLELQLVILGTGNIEYHNLLESIVKKYPKVISLHLKFDDILAHQIYAGSDIFLMPSKYEPCGLGQLISLRYATIPLVYKTGGLADTVNKDNGFVFDVYSKAALLKAIKDAIKKYEDAKAWQGLLINALKSDFSWVNQSKEYVKLYEKARKIK